MSQPRLSIIIPAYQEARRIGKTLDDLAAYLDQHKHHDDTEVLVVVADSPDGTADIARSKAKKFKDFRVVDAGFRGGKGRDVRVGMLEAKGEYRLFMDADLATPLYYTETFLTEAAHGAQVIIAVRNLTSSHTGLRKLISSLGNWLVRASLLPGIPDTQCGFKAFSAEAAEELFRRQTILGWGFDMEILAIARKLGYKIVQVPVNDWSDKPDGTFEGVATSAAVDTLGDLARIIFNKWTGRYRSKTFNYEAHK